MTDWMTHLKAVKAEDLAHDAALFSKAVVIRPRGTCLPLDPDRANAEELRPNRRGG